MTVGNHTLLEEEHVHIMEEYRSGCMSEKSETKLVLVIILIIAIISVALAFDMKRQDEIRKLENQSFTNLSNGLADFGSAWSKLTDEAKATYPCEELVIEENKSMCKEFRGFAIERIRKGK